MFRIKSLLMVALLVVLPLALTGCSRVQQGEVGIKVSLYGSDKGVNEELLGPGRYWIGFNEELHIFPIYRNNYVWTKDSRPESPTDESITFQTVEGLEVNGDFGAAYSIDRDKVVYLFQTFRRGLPEINDSYVRNLIRESVVSFSSTRTIDYIYGAGKDEMIKWVEDKVAREAAEYGIIIHTVYMTGPLRFPQEIVDRINGKIAATQQAEQRENEVRQSIAEARKAIEAARGEADAALLKAQAEAQAIELLGKALRDNPGVSQLRAIEKWDGVVPKYMGAGPLPFLDVTPKN